MSKRKRVDEDEFLTAEDIDELEGITHVPETQPSQVSSDEEEVAPSQKQTRKKKKTSKSKKTTDEEDDGKNIEAGVIEELRLKNFMCHPSLKVEFHDRTTVITGQNGSGKSAVLTAIQVCLGAKTKSTNRGKSIKDLVMTGKESAEITIQLRNQGKDAYKRDIYGKSIIVVKTIAKSGSSSYKIQNSQGKTISKSGKDLQIILEAFNIQIDNPTTCMTQDISREFLAGSSETKKYEFFTRATQLQKMIDSYEVATSSITAMGVVLEDKNNALEDSREELKRREALHINAQNLDNLRKQVEELRGFRVWRMVQDKENELQNFQTHVKRCEEELQKAKAQKESAVGTSMTALEEKKKKLDDELTLIREKLSGVNKESDIVQNKRKNLDNEIMKINQMRTSIKKQIAAEEIQIKSFEKYKQETLAKNKLDKDAITKTKQDEISVFEEKKKTEEEKIAPIESAMELEKNSKMNLIEQVQSVQSDLRKVRNEKVNLDSELSKVEGSRTDKFALVGGAQMKRFLSDIQNNISKFSRPPIGPLSLILTVKDEHLKWAPCIQHALAKSLTLFIVNNFKDGEVLTALKKKHQIYSTHIIQKFSDTMYDVKRNSPKGQLSIFEALDIDMRSVQLSPIKYDDNEVLKSTLFNTLIDQNRIEASVLIETREGADRFMFGENGDSAPPLGVFDCFTLTGTRLFTRGKSKITDTANQTRSTLWTKNVEAEITELKKAIKEKEKDVRIVEHRQIELETEVKKLNESLKKKNDSIHFIKKTIERINRSIDDKQRELADVLNEEDGDQKYIEELDEKIEQRKQKIVELTEKGNAEEQKLDGLKEQITETQKKSLELKKIMSDYDRQMEQKNEEILQTIEEYRNKQGLTRKYEILVQQKENELSRVKEEVAALEKVVHQAIIAANGQTQNVRTDTDLSYEEVNRRMNQKKKELDTETQKLGEMDAHAIKQNYLEYLNTFKDKEKEINISQRCFTSLQKGLKRRMEMWKEIRYKWSQAVSEMFGTYMSQKGHSGKIVFDFDSGQLNFDIHMSTHGKSVHIKDMKSLSGGEKSYTTVSFLLAIWELVETPFRAVDEFDVFMDNMYRKTAMDLILDAAKKKHNTKQLIVITPQDTSIIKNDPEYIKIIQMRPPQRDENQRSMDEFIRQHQN